MTGDDQAPKTLYVGNLSPHVNEELLITLFGQIGECKSCKIIHEPGNDPYAFVEFVNSHEAATALATMNKRNCMGKEMKVNWATTSGNQTKLDSKNYHIFVGDLAPDIDQNKLREAFASFGEIFDVKIMRDPHTAQHKGYGFVSFVNKQDAESAINSMNGQWIGTRKIRTNWATRKVGGHTEPYNNGGGFAANNANPKFGNKLDYNEVWNRTSDTNCTVYCGGIQNFTEDLIRNAFSLYGQVVGVHAFPDRGYAFIRFATKESACNAICAIHGMDLNGSTAKCSWGKENIDISNSPLQQLQQQQQSILAQNLYGVSAAGLNNQSMIAAAQNLNNLQAASLAGSNGVNSAGWGNMGGQQQLNANWAANNYQWPGYPQNAAAMNYWQAAYQGYPLPQQGWGVMPNASAGNSVGNGGAVSGGNGVGGSGQYQQMPHQQGQQYHQQNTNGKS